MNIHEIYIEVKDQAQADRLKDICLKYLLNDTIYDSDFDFNDKYKYFVYAVTGFYISSFISENQTEITEQQFIKLLEDGK